MYVYCSYVYAMADRIEEEFQKQNKIKTNQQKTKLKQNKTKATQG